MQPLGHLRAHQHLHTSDCAEGGQRCVQRLRWNLEAIDLSLRGGCGQCRHSLHTAAQGNGQAQQGRQTGQAPGGGGIFHRLCSPKNVEVVEWRGTV
ncbi:hypothetical protein D9M73_272070 [compost metagenome]